MKCAICGIRKPRRYCPGVRGDICAICCGTEREQTVDCPLDCQFLQDAHDHEKKPEIGDADIPNSDIEVKESFIRRNEPVLILVGGAIHRGAVRNSNTTDWDAREALAALVKTWRTLESGLYYETRPANPYALAICDSVKERIDDVRGRMRETGGGEFLRDADILGILVFLQRLEYRASNGRKKSKGFLDFLHRSFHFPDEESALEAADEPRIII